MAPSSEILTKLLMQLRGRWTSVFYFLIFILCGAFISACCLNAVLALHAGEWDQLRVFDLRFTHFAQLGAVPVVALSMFYEARLLGWEKSSLFRIVTAGTHSRRTDIFYFALYCANLQTFIGLFMWMGLGIYFRGLVHDKFGVGIMQHSPFVLAFTVQWLIGSLFFYLHHRVIHRFFWATHETHHSAEEMNMINNFRAHPFEAPLRSFMDAFPAAILGIHPYAILLYVIISGVVVVWQHSYYLWQLPAWVETYVLIGSRGHQVHHSRSPKHHHKNFGFFVLWEWLFGTLYRRDASESIQIGLEGTLQNTRGALPEMWQSYKSVLGLNFGSSR